MGLDLGRNPSYTLDLVTERGENENDLLLCCKLDEKSITHKNVCVPPSFEAMMPLSILS